ncbi:MAG: insulinase family protein [Gammaproteobacteria bacterium]|nr:insulinase family protein [Gammaproteobacteria bacterium]
MALFAELRRRNVLKVALLYVVSSWLVLWFEDAIRPNVDLPVWTETFVYTILAVGFPVALWFAWTYEITSSGLKKAVDVDQTQSIVYKTGQKLNAAVAVFLVLGVLAVFGQRLLPTFEFLVPAAPVGDPPISSRAPPEIRSLILDNGLKIIVWPDHDIPNVAMYNLVRAGSRYEYPGTTGLSHFFEHLMFLGTSNRAAGQFDAEMEAAGGANNAYTSSDLTVYMNWFPRSALEVIFDLEADRAQNLTFVAEVIASERAVVQAERRSSEDNDNFSKLREQLQATAFIAHPYQFPVIGWPSDIASWTEAQLINHYRTFYAPNNRTLVFVGDVMPKEIFALADDYFAPIPAQTLPAAVKTVEPDQLGERRLVVEAAAQTPLLQVAFHGASARDPDTQRLELLLHLLAGGDSSRLHRLFVEQLAIALSVGAYQDESLDPGLVVFYLTLPPDGDPDLVASALLEQLQLVASEGVSDAELAKAQNIALADYWRELATIDGKAAALGQFDVLHGSYERLFDVPDSVGSITVEDLRDVAASVFRRNNMTVGVLRAPAREDDE